MAGFDKGSDDFMGTLVTYIHDHAPSLAGENRTQATVRTVVLLLFAVQAAAAVYFLISSL